MRVKSRNASENSLVGYSEEFYEWRACGSEADNNPFQRLEPLSAPSLTSLDDRMEKFKGYCTEK